MIKYFLSNPYITSQQGKFEMQWYGCKILSCSYNFKKIKYFMLYSKVFAICNSDHQIRGTVQNSNMSIVTSNIFSVSTSIHEPLPFSQGFN